MSCLEPLGLNVTEGAKVLGVSRQALSNLVNGHARMSIEMAIRLAKAFGSTTETWIRLQASYDVAQAQAHEDEITIERYKPRTPPPAHTTPPIHATDHEMSGLGASGRETLPQVAFEHLHSGVAGKHVDGLVAAGNLVSG